MHRIGFAYTNTCTCVHSVLYGKVKFYPFFLKFASCALIVKHVAFLFDRERTQQCLIEIEAT